MGKREQIIDSASRLFGESNFTGTGMDLIAQESGVTKRTVYSYFNSKEELILAVLTEFESRHRNRLMTSVRDSSSDPRARLLNLFDIYEDWYKERSFQGCLIMAAASEFSTANPRIRDFTRFAFSQLRDYFKQLAEDAGITEPDVLADSWALLYEGATTHAQLTGDTGSAQRAREIAENLLKLHF